MAKSDVLVRMKADTQNYDANIAKARRQLDQFKKDNLSLGGVLKQTSSSLVGMAAQYASVAAAIGAVGGAITSNIATARGFEKSMSQLSSLTGMVGADLEKLKGYAIELGSSTTLSASQVADAFRMIGSQQPQLLASGEALKAVTKNSITLAEAAGIDLATASQTLSTSINQMGGDSNNAERYINVLAAAAQNGAGDIAWLGEAITKSGTTAKAVGTDYEELVANLEQLAKAGFDASTAGTALRSIIMNLEKQANNDFKPSIVGLTQAFENLGKANLSITGYQEIAGKMFASQAKALADAAGEAKNMTAAITGTNTAEEQAKTNTDNLDGSLKSLASAWEGLNLHINSSNGFLRDCVDWLKDLVVWADKAFTEAGKLKGVLSGLNGEEGSGNTKVDQQLKKLKVIKAGGGSDYIFNATLGGMVEDYNRQIMAIDAQVKNDGKPVGGGSGSSQDIRYLQRQMEALKIMRDQLQSGAKDILNPAAAISSAITGGDKSGKIGSGKTFDISKIAFNANKANLAGVQAEDNMPSLKSLFDQSQMDASADAWEKYKDVVTGSINDIGDSMNNFSKWTKNFDPYKEQLEEMTERQKQFRMAQSLAAQAAINFGSALASIDDPGAKAAGTVIQAIANLALSFAMASVEAKLLGPLGWLAWLGAGTAALATTISTVHSLTGYAEGGIVKGNSYSGDNMMFGGDGLYGLNAGELVLTKAQQGSLAQSLQNGGGQTVRVVGKLAGKDLFICAENWAKSAGKGEFVTW
jgi:TP901 family phage tail tape measure protein